MAGHSTVAEWIIKFLGDDADITQVLNGVKGKFQSTLNEMERIGSQIDVFKGLSDSLPKLKAEIDKNTSAVAAFQATIDRLAKAGEQPVQALSDGMKKAETAAASATKEYNKQVDQITKLQSSLTKAGVDTANMAAAETKLALATAEATEALAVQSAKSLLGFKDLASVQPKIDALNAAFLTLRDSGTLAPAAITQASRLLEQEIATLTGSVTNLSGPLVAAGEKGVSAFQAIGGGTLLAVAGIASVAEAIKTVIVASSEFVQSVGKIGTVTELTDAQLHTLGESARALAVTLGLDVKQALESLYQIIRSTNLGPDDALTVLEKSALAAKASFTDLNIVTGVSADLISAFGLKAKDLGAALDALFASSKTGGPTFQDLSGKIGTLSVTAERAGLSVNQMSAFLNVMTSASGDGAGSVTALQQILVKFSTEQVRTQLRDMGISTTNAADAIQQLTARGNVNLNTLLDLGIATIKTSTGVTALTRSSADLDAALARADESLGKVLEGAEKAEKLPHEAIDKLAASWHNLVISLPTAENSTSAVTALTAILNAIGRFQEAQKGSTLDVNAAAEGIDREAQVVDILRSKFITARDAVEDFSKWGEKGFGGGLAQDAQNLNIAIENVNKAIAKLRDEAGGIANALQEDIKGLNESATAQLSIITKIADENIASLDRSKDAFVATAAETTRIQTQLAEDRLKIISDNEKAVNKATTDAIDAREAAARKGRDLTETEEIKLQADLAKIRLTSIQPTIAAYQSLYDNLITQSQAYVTKLEAIEKGRLSFEEGIESQILSLKLGAVDSYGKALHTSLEQDVALANDADRLISLSRAAATKGDVALAEKYANEAIAQSNKIVVAYDADGKIILGQDLIQTEKLKILQQASEAVGIAYDKQGDAAEQGFKDTEAAIPEVLQKLNAVLNTQQKMKELADAGLKVKLEKDEKTYNDTVKAIDTLTAARTIIVNFKVGDVPPALQSVTVPVAEPHAAGGYAGKAIQGFATGGSVFRPLSGSKVPGSGDGDTHPALLNLGSFVMRKAASQHYGDGAMGWLARRFAGGGDVFANFDPTKNSQYGYGTINPNLNPSADLRENLRKSLQDQQDQLVKLKSEALKILQPLIDSARTLPRSQYGQNYGEALEAIRDFVTSATSAADVSALVGPIQQNSAEIAAALATAHKLNVPLVYGLSGKAPGATGTDPLYDALSGRIAGGKPDAPLPPIKRAFGGPVGGDTIPAWLTPGEQVLNPPAVQWAARMFGGGFLDSLNAMQVPKLFLQNMMDIAPPPRYMAGGGYVDGPGAPNMSIGTPDRNSGGVTYLTIQVQKLDEQTLDRVVLPWLNRKTTMSR